jgi:hypothetical protein
MPTPIPFADDGGTRAYRANQATWRNPRALRFPIWRFLIVAAALPPLLALAGIAALAAPIRRHTGMEVGMALCLIAVVGLIGLVWVVFALLAVALVAGVMWPL